MTFFFYGFLSATIEITIASSLGILSRARPPKGRKKKKSVGVSF